MRKPPHGCSETLVQVRRALVASPAQWVVWQELPWLVVPLAEQVGQAVQLQAISLQVRPMEGEALPQMALPPPRRVGEAGLPQRTGYTAGICLLHTARPTRGRSPMVSPLVGQAIEQVLSVQQAQLCSEAQLVSSQALGRRRTGSGSSDVPDSDGSDRRR